MKKLQNSILYVSSFCVAALCLAFSVVAQSSDQNFPTPITSSELSGTIKARDIGDSRLTTYFFTFDGAQGDIFINVVTKNLSGDIDIFSADGLRPLTKMVVYADGDVSETGRLIYLRKPERLLLRIEGRPPGDDPATFRIKFGGSFIALRATEELKPVTTAKKDVTGIRVNSVGTIIETKPKQVPAKNPLPEKPKITPVAASEAKKEEVIAKKDVDTVARKPAVVVEEFPKPEDKTEPVKTKPGPESKPVVTTRPGKPKVTPTASKPVKEGVSPPVSPPVSIEEKRPDPLANIRLVIQLKDGGIIERRLSEVVRFSVDNGILTVIAKDAKIARYSMLLVAKVTIE
jgi:hypothetical protein